MAVGIPEGPSYPGHFPPHKPFFAVLPLNDCRRTAYSLFKIGLFFLFSCLSLTHLLILLPMIVNVHSNPCPVFPWSVCTGNVIWRGRSVQCCTCSNWVYLKCSLHSFSRFRALGSTHSWSWPPCFVPAFLVEIPHLPALWLPPRTLPANISQLLNLVHLAPFC